MDFEWDERKRRANLRAHGIDFHDAIEVFEDPYAREELDPASIEERWRIVGRFARGILFVVYTERDARVRIISARRATKHEQRWYHQGQAH